jgi:serine/threonine protein kinase
LGDAPDLIVQTLGDLLQTVQRLRLKRCLFDDIDEEATIGEGESFSVKRCRYKQQLVAIKNVKLRDLQPGSRSFYRRLNTLLLEIRIMHHKPLQAHPNILSLLGYGWKSSGKDLLPYIMVEFGEYGSLRAFLKRKHLELRSKLILGGDVAAGLNALHLCGIVHGDLKLDNVIVFQSWDRPAGAVAKICDFGHSILPTSGDKMPPKYYGTLLYILTTCSSKALWSDCSIGTMLRKSNLKQSAI